MDWLITLYIALLFFFLTPAIIVRLPPHGSKYTVALVHAVIFALIYKYTCRQVWTLTKGV